MPREEDTDDSISVVDLSDCDSEAETLALTSTSDENVTTENESEVLDKLDHEGNDDNQEISEDKKPLINLKEVCTICDKRYYTNEALISHLRKCHGIIPEGHDGIDRIKSHNYIKIDDDEDENTSNHKKDFENHKVYMYGKSISLSKIIEAVGKEIRARNETYEDVADFYFDIVPKFTPFRGNVLLPPETGPEIVELDSDGDEPSVELNCALCGGGVPFLNRKEYYEHYMNNHKFSCEVDKNKCTATFKSKSQLNDHIRDTHPESIKETPPTNDHIYAKKSHPPPPPPPPPTFDETDFRPKSNLNKVSQRGKERFKAKPKPATNTRQKQSKFKKNNSLISIKQMAAKVKMAQLEKILPNNLSLSDDESIVNGPPSPTDSISSQSSLNLGFDPMELGKDCEMAMDNTLDEILDELDLFNGQF